MKNNIALSAVIGFIASVLMMYLSWEHNSQGEIYAEGRIDFLYLALLGAAWFGVIFVVAFILILIVKKLREKSR